MGETTKKEFTTYFESGGKQHTDEALHIAKEYADRHNVKSIVVASTTGYTAEKAAKIFKGKNLIVVTHVHGFREPDKTEFPAELRKELESEGVKVVTAAHAFGGVSKLVEASIGNIIANMLRIFSEGTKVAVEIAAEAADAGLVSTKEDMIAIAGTGRGADTVIVLKPANSARLFEARVKRILAKPG